MQTRRAEAAPTATPAPAVRRRSDIGLGSKALMIAGVIALLFGTFAVGSLVYGLGGSNRDVATKKGPIIHNEPDSNAAPQVVVDQQPTQILESAPVAPAAVNNVSGFTITNGTDPTALSAQQYSQVIAPAQLPGTPGTFTGVDPRTLTSAPAPPRQVPQPQKKVEKPADDEDEPEPVRQAASRTRPRPISQPIPEFDVRQGGVVRLNLTIGSDGRVKEIDVLKGSPGLTSEVVDAAQNWRFEPATENGRAVEGRFLVDVAFNAHD